MRMGSSAFDIDVMSVGDMRPTGGFLRIAAFRRF